MKVSQSQIAEDLGLSVITVSRALRGHPDLAEATKARVLNRAKEMGYSRLRAAKGGAAAVRVGILLYHEAEETDPLASGIKRILFAEIQRECRKLNVETIVEMPLLNERSQLIGNRAITAAFLLGRYTPEVTSLLAEIPVLAVSSYIQGSGLPRVTADNLNGMCQATEHLIGLGHKRIVFLGMDDPRTRLHRDRARGYLVAMHEAGLKPEIHFCGNSASDIDAVLEARSKPTALACASDAFAFAVYDRLKEKGWRIPEDCSLVSFDGLVSDIATRYQLTTYAPDWALMGRLAATLLVSQPHLLQGNEVVATVPGKMLVQASTAPARG